MKDAHNLRIEDSPIMLRLCDECGIQRSELANLIDTAPLRYKTYRIKKKNSDGTRIILHPASEIKFIQRWLTEYFLADFPVHKSAAAYMPKKSIKWNAERHAKNKYLLKLDFKDFFPSIVPKSLFACLPEKWQSITESDKGAIENLLFCRKHKNYLFLAIGAPSSPRISNIVMYTFDEQMREWCRDKKVTYTRYADDLTFSTDEANTLSKCEKKVKKVLDALPHVTLHLNQEKTVHTSKKHHRRVTGLVLTSEGKVSLGRKKKRELRAAVDYFKHGKLSHDECMRLNGYLAFARSVEPSFLESIQRKYGEKLLAELQKYLQDSICSK